MRAPPQPPPCAQRAQQRPTAYLPPAGEKRWTGDSLLKPGGSGAARARGLLGRLLGRALFQLALEDLPGGVARQLVDEHDLPGNLVVREVLLDVVLDLILAERCAVPQHDERLQALAELVVVNTDRGCLHDAFVRGEELLDLRREYVLAAEDDHLVVAAVDEQPSRAIEVADVARGHQTA